ncbi:MAG: hypothetical protein K5867_10135 [Bacteroidales bacterium]|nr:hypothetical protein [Bacteroidales bacterium]
MPSQATYKNTNFRLCKKPENAAIFQSLSTGKEKDSETGYYYFGARYYNPDLSLWLSVDPMADKYPSLSPYNYCAWNPMKLVDPNGKELDDYQVDRMGRIKKCKDQSNAIDGRDRLIIKRYGGKVRYDKSGTPRNAYIETTKGVFAKYANGSIGKQEYYDIPDTDYDGTAITYDATKVMFGANENDAVKTFTFLADGTDVEWSITGSNNGNQFVLSTSHMRSKEYLGTELADKMDEAGFLQYQFHNHHNGLGASIEDKAVENRNQRCGAVFGYYRKSLGYYNFNNEKIKGPPFK